MPVSAEELFPQVQSAAQVLEKVPAKEREQYPHNAFADNYNNLLALAKESIPETDPRRWPSVKLSSFTRGQTDQSTGPARKAAQSGEFRP